MNQKMLKSLKAIVAEVQHTNATNTRNGGTDYSCRSFLTDWGDDLIAAVMAQPATVFAVLWRGTWHVCLMETAKSYNLADDDRKVWSRESDTAMIGYVGEEEAFLPLG